jgi:hypothetical protein
MRSAVTKTRWRFDNLHIVVRCAIIVAVGLWVGYCAFADENTIHKRVGLVVSMSLYGMLCVEEGRVRERARRNQAPTD